MIEIGFVFKSKNNGDVEVIEYKNHKEVTIKFKNTGFIDSYPAYKLRVGDFVDRSLYKNHKIKIGEIFSTKKSGNLEIIDIYEDKSVKVKFLETGNEKIFKRELSILNGSARESPNKVGEIHITNSGDSIQVIEYVNANNVTIKFLKSGYITKARYQNIKKGQVKEPPIRVGMIFNSTSCGTFKIIEYITYENILIEFTNTSSQKYTDGKSIIQGSVYDIESGIQSHGYRSEYTGYLYIHKYGSEWYKIGITNNYDMRFKTLETNILQPVSFKCFKSEDGKHIRNIETEILRCVNLVKDEYPDEVSHLIKIGKNEIFFKNELEKVLSIIEKYNLNEINVKDGKVCKDI